MIGKHASLCFNDLGILCIWASVGIENKSHMRLLKYDELLKNNFCLADVMLQVAIKEKLQVFTLHTLNKSVKQQLLYMY